MRVDEVHVLGAWACEVGAERGNGSGVHVANGHVVVACTGVNAFGLAIERIELAAGVPIKEFASACGLNVIQHMEDFIPFLPDMDEKSAFRRLAGVTA